MSSSRRRWVCGLVLAFGCGQDARSTPDASRGDGGSGDAATGDAGPCVAADLLWSEDWESGSYARWTGMSYDAGWGNACQANGVSTDHAVSGTHAHRSEIVCAYPDEGNVHRGYGGLQFDGDTVLPAHTNTGQGLDAPGGVVNTFHVWLDSPTVFTGGTWFSLWTVNGSCDYTEEVLTLGLEDPSNLLATAHYQPGGGTRTYAPGAPGMPRGRWVRITIYVNYHDEILHVWQDGVSISHVTFVRASTRMCQWHWGAYASGDNTDVVLYEDDNALWKLAESWTTFDVEPWLGPGAARPVCR